MHAHPTTIMNITGSAPGTPSYPQQNMFVSGTPNSSLVSTSNIPPAYLFHGGSPTTSQQQTMHKPQPGSVMPINTNTGTKLFVGQVPSVCSEEILYPIFAQFGPLLEVKIMREPNGRSKGSAWVRYVHEEHAQAAIAALHERHVVPPQTNPLRVQLAAPSGPKTQNNAPPSGAAVTPMIVPVAYQSPYGAAFYTTNAAPPSQQQMQTYYAAPAAQPYQYGVNPSILALPPQASPMDNQPAVATGGRMQQQQQPQPQRAVAPSPYYTSVGNPAGQRPQQQPQQQSGMNGYCVPSYTMMSQPG